jgi:hypothetical protein
MMTRMDIEIDRHEAAIEAGQLPAYCPFCEDADYAWVRCEECGVRVCEYCVITIDGNGHFCPDCARKPVCRECGGVGKNHLPSCAFLGSDRVDNALVT